MSSYPLQREKLRDIYNRASYYAGYFIHNVKGNLKIHISCSAESNHVSIKSHLGECGMWSITKQIKRLMIRQQYFMNLDQKNNDTLFLQQEHYRSTFVDEVRKMDETAKRYLSNYAYNHLWIKTLDGSHKFEHRLSVDKQRHII